MKLSRLTGIILAASTIGSTFAKDRGLFIGLEVGSASYDEQGFKDNASSNSIVGGLKVNEYFKLQGNLYDLGGFNSDSSIIDSVEISGLAVSAVGTLPLGDSGFEVYGRAGLSLMTYVQNIEFFDGTIENESTGDAIVTGLGATYTHSSFKRWTFHIGFENYYFETTNLSSTEHESHSVNNFVLGARFNF